MKTRTPLQISWMICAKVSKSNHHFNRWKAKAFKRSQPQDKEKLAFILKRMVYGNNVSLNASYVWKSLIRQPKHQNIISSQETSRKAKKNEVPATRSGCRKEQICSINLLWHRRRCAWWNKSNAMSRGEDRGKRWEACTNAMNYNRTKVSFALFHSSIPCFRGCRSMKRNLNIQLVRSSKREVCYSKCKFITWSI